MSERDAKKDDPLGDARRRLATVCGQGYRLRVTIPVGADNDDVVLARGMDWAQCRIAELEAELLRKDERIAELEAAVQEAICLLEAGGLEDIVAGGLRAALAEREEGRQ